MNEIDKLDELREQQKELAQKWHAQVVAVTDKLYNDLLGPLNNGPSQLYYPEDKTISIDDYDWPEREGFKWKVRVDVKFCKQPDDTTSRLDYDFGSGFDLYITNFEIKVNHGSCGTWGLEDKGQWSRILLIKAIFDHQDDIIRELDKIIDISIGRSLTMITREIDNIERDIRLAKEKREKEEVLSTITIGKYFAKRGYHWEWDEVEESKKVYHFYDIEKIVKITDKNFIIKDNYGDTHFRNKDIWLMKIKNKTMYVINSKDEECPQEETK